MATAKWGSHSLRRKADKDMRMYCAKHGLKKEEIDLEMGWNQAEMNKDMQFRYDEEDLVQRMNRAQITAES